MRKGLIRRRWCLTSALMLIAAALFSVHPRTSGAWAAAMQGKGGTIKPAPTPTPATTKTTSPKKSTTPAKASRTGASNPARQGESSAAKPSAAEIAFWESIKDSKNPEEFRAYLKKYPNGEFADLARGRLNSLETAAKEEEARKEEAKRKEDEARRHPSAGAVMKNNIGMELVYVPAGSFMMGDPQSSKTWQPHQVTIREGFYMGRYEVTQAQWQAVMGTSPSSSKGDNLPVEMVRWDEVQEFVKRLNARNDGFTYRLPTEAEWEYAERAGTTSTYFWGEDRDQVCLYANAADKTYKTYKEAMHGKHPAVVLYDSNLTCRDGYAETAPVGSFKPNAFGLYDMTGNVWEMCEDFFHENYDGAPVDGSAWLSGEDKYHSRVIRGAGWNNDDFFFGSSYRARNFPSSPGRGDTGFRVVAVLRPQ